MWVDDLKIGDMVFIREVGEYREIVEFNPAPPHDDCFMVKGCLKWFRRSDVVSRRITVSEAVKIASVNFERMERLLAKEVERDAYGPAVWEDDEDEGV
jgi:hypothetical protein